MPNNPQDFKFNLADEVKISRSGEEGKVISRAQHLYGHDQFQVSYKAADGRAVDGWFVGDDLETLKQ